MASHLLAIDQGTTSTRAILFDAALAPVAFRAARVSADLSRARLGRARPAGHLDHARSQPRAPRWRAPAFRRRTSPPSASPTSARPRSSGTARPASRSTTRSSGRTAAPPMPARRCARAGHETAGQRAHRAAARSLFLGHQDRLAARQCRAARAQPPKRASSPSARSTASCSGGFTGGKVHATDATNASRTLLFDIRSRRSGTTSCSRCSACRARCCRRCATAPPISAPRCRPVRRADPHPRHRRRPAGGDRRAGLLHARHDEIDLRHRLLRAAQHRRRAGAHRATACSPPSPISSTASAPMRSKARSSSPARRCSGCATG